MDGFTSEQRVLIGWAQVWLEKSTEEAARNRINTDRTLRHYFRSMGLLETWLNSTTHSTYNREILFTLLKRTELRFGKKLFLNLRDFGESCILYRQFFGITKS